MQLRDYQRAALDDLYAWLRENDGHPCLVLPTGAVHTPRDGVLSWEDLQACKNIVWGPAAQAVEVFPPDGRVVNEAPMRHLWRTPWADACCADADYRLTHTLEGFDPRAVRPREAS